MKPTITMISPKKLYHHPNNPRVDYNDIDELADSIRHMGVLQNLSVVHYDAAEHGMLQVDDPNDSYIVIIGNRRMEGALLAGVDEVPCIIVEMTLVEQLCAMEAENGLRSSASPRKQAENYQLMLNLGESVASIAEKTGFSEVTIRNRVKLLDLDRDMMAEADQRGGTLTDYMQLNKLQYTDLKNQVLAYVGTSNFQYELKKAKDTQKKRKYMEEALPFVSSFAQQVDSITNSADWLHVRTYASWSQIGLEAPEDVNTREFCFIADSDSIRLYRKRDTDEKNAISAKKQMADEQQKINHEMEQAAKRAFELRSDFIYNLSAATAKKHFSAIAVYAGKVIRERMSYYNSFDAARFSNLFGISFNDKIDEEEMTAHMAQYPERGMLVLAYCYADNNRMAYTANRYDRDKEYSLVIHKPNPELDELYGLLTSLGYEMSSEEKALQDGTHPYFSVVPEENNTVAA